jgi:CRISPR/Cas system-associated protein Csm6
MPLDLVKLTNSLIALDQVTPAKSALEAATRWSDALVDFNKDMTYLIAGAEELGRVPLLAALTPAFLPVSTLAVFAAAVEAGLRAFWLAAATPATVTLASAVYTPSVVVLAPLLVPVAPIGIVAPNQAAPRIYLATQIYTWTLSNALTTPGPTVFPFL